MRKQERQNPDASRRYHDRVARKYDQSYQGRFWEYHDELTWRSIRKRLPADATAHCLDLGCGTGKWGLRLLRSGFPTTFVDQSAAMVERSREKAAELGPKARRAEFLAADMVAMPGLESDKFSLILAMGDPLSICSDAHRAVAEILRTTRPGGVVIATADNTLAALDHFAQAGDLDALAHFVRTGKTHWLTDDTREQFALQTFLPNELRKLFEKAGFEVLELIGKTVLPIRHNEKLLAGERAIDVLLELEKQLARDDASVGRASHLQITARKPLPPTPIQPPPP